MIQIASGRSFARRLAGVALGLALPLGLAAASAQEPPGQPGVDRADFELWSLAVSAINGCGMCIDAHDKVLRAAGVSAEQIQAAVRIASVVHAVAATLDGLEASETSRAQAA